jgi:MoxR-like ATPase
MPADVMGHSLYDLQRGEFSVRKGPVFTNLLLADEINRAPAKTQSALLEAMQEAQVTIDGQSHPLAAPFMVLATQNPIEQEGTYPLPEAQLDRFLLKISIEYPSQAEEISMVRSITQNKIGDGLDVAQVQAVLSPAGLLTLQQLVASLRVDEQVLDYAVRIVRATRQFSGISNGAGPRAAIAIIRVARAAALLAGRDFVTPDDIKTVAIPALRHRVRLSPEMEIEGQTADSVLARLLTQITAPRG